MRPNTIGEHIISFVLFLSFDQLDFCRKSVTVLPSSGAHDIQIGVDDDGFIFLGYEAVADDESEALWRRNYSEPIDSERAREETTKKGCDCLL